MIILDLMMPEMSGVEFFMYLRGARLCEDATVVAVSAGASDADRALLNELGVGAYIPKGPELRVRLTALVRALAGTARAPLKSAPHLAAYASKAPSEPPPQGRRPGTSPGRS